MNRPSGVTAAAVVMMIGSGVFLLMAALILVVVLMLPGMHTSDVHRQTQTAAASMSLGCIVYLGGGILGLITAAGLLRLRAWARMVTLVFAGLALVMSIFLMIGFLLLPIPAHATMTPQFVLGFRLITLLILLIPASICLWWLIYFNTAGAKAQFAGEPVSAPGGLPLSMQIIGWYLIITSLFAPVATLQYGLAVFLIWILHPPASYAWAAMLAMWGIFSGIGMLRSQRWGWAGAVAFHIFSLISVICSAAKPEMFQRLMEAVAARNPSHAIPSFTPGMPFFRVMMVFSVTLAGVILWFLVTRRSAFGAVNGGVNAVPPED